MKSIKASFSLIFVRRQNGTDKVVQNANQDQNEEERLGFGLQLQADNRYESNYNQKDERKEANVVQRVLEETNFEVIENLENRIRRSTQIQAYKSCIRKTKKKANVCACFRTQTPRYHRINSTGSYVTIGAEGIHRERGQQGYDCGHSDL